VKRVREEKEAKGFQDTFETEGEEAEFESGNKILPLTAREQNFSGCRVFLLLSSSPSFPFTLVKFLFIKS
jgi:hypothetical protein